MQRMLSSKRACLPITESSGFTKFEQEIDPSQQGMGWENLGSPPEYSSASEKCGPSPGPAEMDRGQQPAEPGGCSNLGDRSTRKKAENHGFQPFFALVAEQA